MLFYGIIIINIRDGCANVVPLTNQNLYSVVCVGACASRHLQLRFLKAKKSQNLSQKQMIPTIVIVHGRLCYAQCQKYVASQLI